MVNTKDVPYTQTHIRRNGAPDLKHETTAVIQVLAVGETAYRNYLKELGLSSGRTDAGVHAWGQVANFHLPASCAGMSAEELKAYLNRYLPDDIAVLSAQEAGTRFHSRLNAVSKTYCYRIETAAKKMYLSADMCTVWGNRWT